MYRLLSIVLVLCLFSCGGGEPVITLNDNFKAALRRNPNTPSFIVKAVESEIYSEIDSQTDFEAWNSSSNIDTATDPGSLKLPKVTPAIVSQVAKNTTCIMSAAFRSGTAGTTSSPATPGTTSFVWQSFKNGLTVSTYIDKIYAHLYATGESDHASWNNTFYFQVFDAKNGTALSTVRSIGGANYTIDSQKSIDFSSERILLASGSTYWVKIWSISTATTTTGYTFYYAFARTYVRYQNTNVYADGQADVKPYDASESVNVGDLAFKVTFLPNYSSVGYAGYLLDTGATPTVAGEFRSDSVEPLDSVLDYRLYSMSDQTSLVETIGSDATVANGAAFNGKRLVRVLAASPYAQYSDDYGANWASCSGLSAAMSSIVWSGQVFAATTTGSTNTMFISADGITFSSKTLPATDNWTVHFAGAYLFALRSATATVTQAYSTPDGLTWSTATMINARMYASIAYGAGIYVCFSGTNDVQRNGYCTATTPGGTWTNRAAPATAYWGPVIFGKNIFIVVCNNSGNEYYTSDTGLAGSWTLRNFHATKLIYSPDIVQNGIGFFAYATSVTGTVDKAFSVDGITWDVTESSNRIPLLGAISFLDGYYAVNGTIATYSKEYHYPDFAYIGTLAEGDALPSGIQYFFILCYLSPDTTGTETPVIRSIRLYYPTWLTFSTTPEKGYEPSVSSVSSLQTAIDTFKPSTVGQVSISFALTAKVGGWLQNNYPRNKEIRIYAGFTDIAEADYISYYRGNVEDWTLDQNRNASVTLRDFTKTWAGSPVPATWVSVANDKTWTAQHPVDVMIDILQGYVGVGSKGVSIASFDEVKNLLSGWIVTNTITGKTQDAKALLEQLRLITGTYFIPGENGRIKLKRWNPLDASSADLTDDEMIGVQYRGNSASLVNLINWYFNLKPDGTSKSGDIALHQEQDGMSQFNWAEKKTIEVKDYWTLLTEEVDQVYPIASEIIVRYSAIPDILSFSLDLRFVELEVADIVSITTSMVPTATLVGISNVKYQITRLDLDFTNSRIKLEVLRVA